MDIAYQSIYFDCFDELVKHLFNPLNLVTANEVAAVLVSTPIYKHMFKMFINGSWASN